MVVLLTRHLKSTGGDRRRIKGVWISLLFPLFSADTPDVKRFAQVFLSQCSHWRASAYVGGPNLLTWWFSRPFDEARLLVTAQNLLPKRPNAPFYVLIHCTISSCQRGGSFWQLLLWCKLCHTKRSTSPSCCRDLRSNLRSF